MMGLALGVDYALLMVSRFREELAGGADPKEAAIRTRHTAGRTTVFAGSTLIAAMLVALFIVPGALLASLAATVILVVILSVSVATIAGPAVLALLGHNVNRWRIGRPQSYQDESRGLMVIVGAALKRPVLVCLVVGTVVLALAAPTIGLKTGPPSAQQLSHNNQARKDAELINRTIAPGFDAPFVVVAEAEKGPITTPERLDALRQWQDKVAKIPGVQVVIGPEQVSKSVAPLREAGNGLLVEKGGPVGNLEQLGRNLKRAAKGVARLRAGISEATQGAGLLVEGSDTTQEGALRLASGLATRDRRQRRSGRRARPIRGRGKEAPEGRRRDHEGCRRSGGRGRIHRQDDGRPQHQRPQQRAAPLAEAAEKTDEVGARRTRRPEAVRDRHQQPAADRDPAAADDDGRQDRPELQRRPRRRPSGGGLLARRSSPASTSSRSA